MSLRNVILTATLAIGLTMPTLSQALSQHAHPATGAALQPMALDQGRKWPTDETLRTIMSQIRVVTAEAPPRIHSGQFSDRDYAALADTVQKQIDDIVANCKLPEEADLQLHFALTHMLDGLSEMKSGSSQELGAIALTEALKAYGDHFDHPGWPATDH